MTEMALIKKAQKGATHCFSQLVARYQTRLYSYLLSRCHNPTDADDVLQETFINAYQYLHTYKTKWAFSTWLFTIARRLLQRFNKAYFLPVDDIHLTAKQPAMSAAIEHQNVWRLIKRHISQDCYDAMWFYYKEDMSIKDIASIVNKSESWVKTNLHRSKMNLRDVPELRQLIEI